MNSREWAEKIADKWGIRHTHSGIVDMMTEAIDAALAAEHKARSVPGAPLSEEELREIEQKVEKWRKAKAANDFVGVPAAIASMFKYLPEGFAALLAHIRYIQGPTLDWLAEHDPEGAIRQTAHCAGLEEGAKVTQESGNGPGHAFTRLWLGQQIRARICARLGKHEWHHAEQCCMRCGLNHPVLGG